MILGEPAVCTCPLLDELRLATGLPKFGLLNKLKDSARKSRCCDSRI